MSIGGSVGVAVPASGDAGVPPSVGVRSTGGGTPVDGTCGDVVGDGGGNAEGTVMDGGSVVVPLGGGPTPTGEDVMSGNGGFTVGSVCKFAECT